MRKDGVSLFEILVALIVFSIAITGIITLFNSAKKFQLHNRSNIAGSELGKLFLDPLQQDVNATTWSVGNCVSTDGTNTNCDPASQTQTVNNINYTLTYNKDQVPGTNLRRVQLQLNWNELSP